MPHTKGLRVEAGYERYDGRRVVAVVEDGNSEDQVAVFNGVNTNYLQDLANARMFVASDAMRETLEAEEAYSQRGNGVGSPWHLEGTHRCNWCGECVDRLAGMRRAALKLAQEGQ